MKTRCVIGGVLLSRRLMCSGQNGLPAGLLRDGAWRLPGPHSFGCKVRVMESVLHARAPPGPPWERLNIPITPCEVLAISRHQSAADWSLTEVRWGLPPFRGSLGFVEQLHRRRRGSPARVHQGERTIRSRGLDDGPELITRFPAAEPRYGPTTGWRQDLGSCRPGVRQRPLASATLSGVPYGKGDLERAATRPAERRHAPLALQRPLVGKHRRSVRSRSRRWPPGVLPQAKWGLVLLN